MKNYALIFAGLIILSVFVVFASSKEANVSPPTEHFKYETLRGDTPPALVYNIAKTIEAPDTPKKMTRNYNDTMWGKSDDSDLKILQKHHAVLTNQLSNVDSLIEVKKSKKK